MTILVLRLDKFYIGKNNSNRVLKTNIFPNGFNDHHLCMIEMIFKKSQCSSYYWHFNLKLLHDSVKSLSYFGLNDKNKKVTMKM